MNRLQTHIFALIALMALVVAGCGGSNGTYSPKLEITSTPAGNFTLSGGPPQTVAPGAAVTFTISSAAFTSQPQSRSDKPISLVVLSGLPTGATGTLNPTVINPGQDSTLTVQTLNDTAPNDYDIVVQGTQDGVSKTATVRLTIQSTFFLNGGGSKTVQPGQTATYTITPATTDQQQQSRAANDVTYQVVSGVPTGATATFEPVAGSIGNSGTFKVVTTDTTPLGTYTIVVRATWGNKTADQTVTLNVVAPDFFLTAPSVVNMVPGVDTDVTVNINPVVAEAFSRGFDDVNLQLLGTPPSGFTVQLLQNTAKIGGSVTLRIRYEVAAGITRVNNDPIIGNFTIEGTNGAFTHTTITSAFVTIPGNEDTF
jgi:hypothetical protein